ncbi:luciferase family protein [Actinomadura gamaensis]|uniref:Luciferase family protein n=1 Tax=Actinomadura gamaensis TaxID=1763541 RepID=A0ABV9UCK9_9ACTN
MAANGSGATAAVGGDARPAGRRAAGGNGGRLLEQVGSWPDVSVVRADCGFGRALATGGRQVLHLHGDEAEFRLTRPVLDRLGEALAGTGRVRVRPGGEWVAVRLDTDSDLALALALTSVAIKATAAVRDAGPCGAAASRTG